VSGDRFSKCPIWTPVSEPSTTQPIAACSGWCSFGGSLPTTGATLPNCPPNFTPSPLTPIPSDLPHTPTLSKGPEGFRSTGLRGSLGEKLKLSPYTPTFPPFAFTPHSMLAGSPITSNAPSTPLGNAPVALKKLFSSPISIFY